MSKLVDGLIPKGQECPFLKDCGFRKETCPSAQKPRARDFSCGAARAWDLAIRTSAPDPERTNEKPEP